MQEYSEIIEIAEEYIESLKNKREMLSSLQELIDADSQIMIVKTPVYEWVLVNSFIDYELMISKIFKKLMMHPSSVVVRPPEESDIEGILQSFNSNGEKFLDWTDPKRVLNKSKVYLGEDNLVEKCLLSSVTELGHIRRIRNYISHKSIESEAQYRKVVQDILTSSQTWDFNNRKLVDFIDFRPGYGRFKHRVIIFSLVDDLIRLGENIVTLASGELAS